MTVSKDCLTLIAFYEAVFLNLFDIMEHLTIIFFLCGVPFKLSLVKKGQDFTIF